MEPFNEECRKCGAACRGIELKNGLCSICQNPLNLKPIPDYGDLFTIDEFMKLIKNKTVWDEDGIGYFATIEGLSDIVARPSTLFYGWPMVHTGEFTHIIWFNK